MPAGRGAGWRHVGRRHARLATDPGTNHPPRRVGGWEGAGSVRRGRRRRRLRKELPWTTTQLFVVELGQVEGWLHAGAAWQSGSAGTVGAYLPLTSRYALASWRNRAGSSASSAARSVAARRHTEQPVTARTAVQARGQKEEDSCSRVCCWHGLVFLAR